MINGGIDSVLCMKLKYCVIRRILDICMRSAYNFYMVSEQLISGAIEIIETVEFCAGGIRICCNVSLVSKLRCLSTDCDWSMPLRAARIILHGRTGWRRC